MKMYKRFICAILFVFLLSTALLGCRNTDKDKKKTGYDFTTLIGEPKTDWKAEWIWTPSCTNNSWVNFRKTVTLSGELKNVTANIASESRYWLYINGKQVVFDGGLKRGPTPEDGYYDEIDLSDYLKTGENTIAALVWYWGSDMSFSSYDCGQGGFLFEAKAGGTLIKSDDTWKATRNLAYVNDTGSQQPNERLPESNIMYKAENELSGWEKPEYDDSAWKAAYSFGKGGCSPWNQLYKRPIPQWKNYGLKDYVNSSDFTNHTTTSLEKITCRLPYNAQLTPYLKIEAPAGLSIKMTTDNVNIGAVLSSYVTKEGEQEFEAFGWFNGEEVTYEIPKGVKILSLQYRETGYATEFAGSFTSDDDYFNTLWEKSLRTLYVTMRDNYMDCPDRERSQWWGDVSIEMAMSMYALDASSYDLYKKGVATMLAYIDEETNVLQTVVPIQNAYFELPVQQLAGICAFWTYYEYTGDIDFLNVVYLPAKNYLDLWEIGADGLVVHRPGSWDWVDWGGDPDVAPLENAWYYYALSTVRSIAERIGKSDDIPAYTQKMEGLYEAYQTMWTEKGYRSAAYTPASADDRGNAVAVLAGLADESKYEAIEKLLSRTMNSSPYMEKYVLDALCKMDAVKAAQKRMKSHYRGMVNDSYSTLWEVWDKSGSLNHAWSGGPLISMSKYMAGIYPTSPGYETFMIAPDLGLLSSIKATVPSIKGSITADISLDDESEIFKMTCNVPDNTTATIGIPKFSDTSSMLISSGDTVIFEDKNSTGNIEGISYKESTDAYVYFTVAPGVWDFYAKTR